MPYVTTFQKPYYPQISFEDIIFDRVDMTKLVPRNLGGANTRTNFVDVVKEEYAEQENLRRLAALDAFVNRHKGLYQVERSELYETFYIPKKSGGLRRIDAPKPELSNALRELKTIFEAEFKALHHTTAFAYVKNRSTVDAIKRHQKNESYWFLKTDFSNFFGSTTPEFLYNMLSMIYPFSSVCESKNGQRVLKTALHLCFLNGGLPQGTPISPMLTNLMMIPFDHIVSNSLTDFGGKRFVYTRYADDILISCRKDFKYQEVVQFLREKLAQFNAPFYIKNEKTRYGSRNGQNWNLGLMLNKDNAITIGNRNKKRLKAMLDSYIRDRVGGKPWNLHDIQVMNGHLEYCRMVEKSYANALIAKENEKHGVDLMAMLKEDL